MRYAYRCAQCELTADPREQPRYARRDRDLHRRLAHHGYTPDGEEILRIPTLWDRGLRATLTGLAATVRRAVEWWITAPGPRRFRAGPAWPWVKRAAGAAAALYALSILATVYL